MADLSPAARAVLDAALGEAGPAFEPLARVMAAAALRAVVRECLLRNLVLSANNLELIAAELEDNNA